MLSNQFHINILAQTKAESGPSPALFPRTFEEVSSALAALSRMFVEPDGSFVWVASGEPAWQLDGVLYDGVGRLWYVDLKGRCPEDEFDRLLSALGWPESPVVIQLVREAVELDEQAFRRHVGWEHQPRSGGIV